MRELKINFISHFSRQCSYFIHNIRFFNLHSINHDNFMKNCHDLLSILFTSVRETVRTLSKTLSCSSFPSAREYPLYTHKEEA